MNTQQETHPAITLLVTTAEMVVLDGKTQKSPSKEQAIKAISEIINLDLNCDWSVYHSMLVSYLYGSGIKIKDSLDLEATCDYLNAFKVPAQTISEFLEIHTITYSISE